MNTKNCIAFAGMRRIAAGDLAMVALEVRTIINGGERLPILIFDDTTSEPVELDFRGSVRDVLARLEKSGYGETTNEASKPDKGVACGPGRPKLGVIGREVTLLPRHWDWLAGQPGGASVTLRKLVEAARKTNEGQDRVRIARDATYRFMVAMAGDLPGFEEATRALFSKGENRFQEFQNLVRTWPKDIRQHVIELMKQTA